jgi:Cu2+-exporting ATPase
MSPITAQPNPDALIRSTSGKSLCAHCGLDVPQWSSRGEQELQFCCHGCEAAYELLAGCGLQAFYDYREGEGSTPGRRAGLSDTFEDFDDPVFEEDYVTRLGERTRQAELLIEGLHCRACVWLLERLSRIDTGILESRLNLHRQSLTVTWDSNATTLSKIAQLLQRLGYFPHAASEGQAQRLDRQEQRRRLTQIAIAGAIAGNLMIISVSLYAGWISGMSIEIETFFRWVSAGLGSLTMALPGRVFFQQAWAGVKARVPNMDLPIALGLGLGTIAGVVNTIRGLGEIYFDSLAMLVFLLLVGRWIQYRQHRRAAQMIHQLYELTPRRARQVDEQGQTRWVPVKALNVGDSIKLLANETVPADGRVKRGLTTVDRSLLTGESAPASAQPGDQLYAGMVNLSAAITVEVTAKNDHSRLSQLIELIEGAALRKTPIVQLADRMGGYFVIVVILLTLVTAVGWSLAGDPGYLDHAIALAIVACPCALGLATPLAVAVAIGRAARQSILIQGGDVLERLNRTGHIWFDKTGTLTWGALEVHSWVGDSNCRPAVAALERHSSHPAAKAIVTAIESELTASELALESERLTEVQQSEQGGIQGCVEGQSVVVGNRRFLESCGVPVTGRWSRWARWVGRHAKSPVFVAVDQQVVAGATLGDRIRVESKQVLRDLQKAGWSVGILSGDHPLVVDSVARELGIPKEWARGGLLPEDKLACIRETQSQNRSVLMIGDGLNDSAALAAADVGISMKTSAEASLESADIHLGSEGVLSLCDLLKGAGETVRTVRWALAASLAYNLVAVMLAALGWINPLVAALLMPVSSLTVLSIALSGPAFRSKTTDEPVPSLQGSR